MSSLSLSELTGLGISSSDSFREEPSSLSSWGSLGCDGGADFELERVRTIVTTRTFVPDARVRAVGNVNGL